MTHVEQPSEQVDRNDAVEAKIPRLLGPNATKKEIVNAVNGLAIELQLERLSIRQVATTVETMNRTMEKGFKDLADLVRASTPQKRQRKPKAAT